MPDFIHKTTLDFHLSRDPNELPEAVGNYLEDPDLSAVGTGTGNGFTATVLKSYWKLDIPGNAVLEMDAGEKAAVDAALVAAQLASDKSGANADYDQRLWKAFAKVVLDEINLLRAEHSLAARTVSQLKTAVQNAIDTV